MAAATANQVLGSQRMRRIVLALIALAAIYLLAVSPARTWWQQRQEMHAASARYEMLVKQNKQLEGRKVELQDDKTIAVIARERYELVPAGSNAYAVMPAPSQAVDENAQAQDAKKSRNWFEKAVDTVEFWN